MGPIRTRGSDSHFWRMCLAALLAASLTACSAGLPSLPSIKNPFKKKEETLPGERIAVITDQSLEAPDPAAAGKPIALPPPVANASWAEPGGSPSNSLGHLALGDRLNKAWRVDIGTGSSSSGRLSAVPLVADGKVFTLDAGGTVERLGDLGDRRPPDNLWKHPEKDAAEDGERRHDRERDSETTAQLPLSGDPVDHAAHGPAESAVGDDGGVLAGAAGHHHQHVVGRRHLGQHG